VIPLNRERGVLSEGDVLTYSFIERHNEGAHGESLHVFIPSHYQIYSRWASSWYKYDHPITTPC